MLDHDKLGTVRLQDLLLRVARFGVPAARRLLLVGDAAEGDAAVLLVRVVAEHLLAAAGRGAVARALGRGAVDEQDLERGQAANDDGWDCQ